jgi:hypothetical protein
MSDFSLDTKVEALKSDFDSLRREVGAEISAFGRKARWFIGEAGGGPVDRVDKGGAGGAEI